MVSIPIYASESLSRAADLTSSSDTTDEYIAGVVDLVARVVYPELGGEAGQSMAATRIADYIREGR